ncbi:hypothetical protein Hanom_Chr04g00353541 [Helianthus anomalus]
MSHTGRSTIRSVLTARDLESFVETYKIPERFSPTLPGPDDSAECTPDRIVIYTLSFSSCGVRYPLSYFKVDLLRHFKVHFSQLHPLGFMRVVHLELSCVAVSGESSIPLFCMFYKLISDGDWFTFSKRKDNISQLCYSFMPTSTYPKEWKKMTLWGLLQGDCKDVQFVVASSCSYDNWLRLRSASGQKAFPATRAASELPPPGVKGSLSKHLRSSSLVSEPLLGSSNAPIEIPIAPSSSRIQDKTPEVSVARVTPAFEISPLDATGTSKPSHLEDFASRSPLAPLFADALPIPYVPKWKIAQSTVVATPETAREFMAHVIPPSHRFMNSALRVDLFDDQYNISLCEGFFRVVVLGG